MRSFQHTTPPLRLFSGSDSLAGLGRELDRLGSRRAVILCGASVSGNAALMDLLRSAAGERCAGMFDGVRAHSPVLAVQAAAAALRDLGADAVIAVGGGSAVVTARAASILLAEKRHPQELCTVNEAGVLKSPKLSAPKLPQLVVPTTPNTATVKAGTAVFDPASGTRLALYDPKTRAQSVFIHPDFLASCPPGLVRGASLDSFAFAIEGLLSRSGDPIAQALLTHSVRLAALHLGKDSPAARSGLTMAAILCGQGTDHAGAGIATVLGHAAGARCHLDNGLIKAIVLPEVLRFVAEWAEPGLQQVATALGLQPSSAATLLDEVLGALARLYRAAGVPRRLRDAGLPSEALPGIAQAAMADWFLGGSPRPVNDPSDLTHVLDAAW